MNQHSMDLSVTLKGPTQSLHLKNPVLTASGTFGYGMEFAPYGDLTSLGGIIVKGLSLLPRDGNPCPRIVETTAGMLNAVGLQNDGVEAFCKEKLPRLPWQHLPVIANLYATSPAEFGELAARLNEEEGVAALEVNVSCPNVKSGGILFGQDPKLAAAVTRAARDAAPNKPLIIKLSPNVTDIALMARSVQDAGADMISCINTLSGMAVDVARRKPRLANVIGGLSGPAIKPVALRCVWQTARAVSIPVIGIGGIVCAEDVLEFILVGAHAVQIGTGNFLSPDCAFSIVSELPAACARLAQGHIHLVAHFPHSVDDLIHRDLAHNARQGHISRCKRVDRAAHVPFHAGDFHQACHRVAHKTHQVLERHGGRVSHGVHVRPAHMADGCCCHRRAGADLRLTAARCAGQERAVGDHLSHAGSHIHGLHHRLLRNLMLHKIRDEHRRQHPAGPRRRRGKDTFHAGIVAAHLQGYGHDLRHEVPADRIPLLLVLLHQASLAAHKPAPGYAVRLIGLHILQHDPPHAGHLIPGRLLRHVPLCAVLNLNRFPEGDAVLLASCFDLFY